MPIDLTSAGTRALATLDSVADMQNSLKLVHEHLRNYQLATKAMDLSLSRIPSFIKNNPSIEAEWLLPPVSNISPPSPVPLHPVNAPISPTDWSHPSARNVYLDNSKIFQSSVPLWCVYVDNKPIKDFI